MIKIMAIAPVVFFALPFGFAVKASGQECDCSTFNVAVEMCEDSGTDDNCIDTVSREPETRNALSPACIQKCADTEATKKLTEEEVGEMQESPFVPLPPPPGAMVDEPERDLDEGDIDDYDDDEEDL